METRLIVAYALLAILVIGSGVLVALWHRKRRQHRRMMRGRRLH